MAGGAGTPQHSARPQCPASTPAAVGGGSTRLGSVSTRISYYWRAAAEMAAGGRALRTSALPAHGRIATRAHTDTRLALPTHPLRPIPLRPIPLRPILLRPIPHRPIPLRGDTPRLGGPPTVRVCAACVCVHMCARVPRDTVDQLVRIIQLLGPPNKVSCRRPHVRQPLPHEVGRACARVHRRGASQGQPGWPREYYVSTA